MYHYEYKGQEINTIFHYDLSDEQFEELKKQYYSKPDFGNVEKELKRLKNGGTKISEIKKYYVKDLMAKVRLYHSKWSVEDVFNCKDLLGIALDKVSKNKKVYPPEKSTISNIETFFRLGAKGVCSIPSNFPLKVALNVLDKYNINNNWYDFSCGWGVRLISALVKGVNYYGTDPNFELTERLNQLGKDYNKVNGTNNMFKILTQGSEKFIPELENKIGLAFSSPPYFKLEMYNVGEQSCSEDTEYKTWLKEYLYPTILNIYKYLIDDGYFLININNYSKYKLVEHTKFIVERSGFKYIGYETLNNTSKRVNSKGGLNDNSEKIMVFKKRK